MVVLPVVMAVMMKILTGYVGCGVTLDRSSG
jgi:hypothetical protein